MAGRRTVLRRGIRWIAVGSGPLRRTSDRLEVAARVLVALALLAAVPVSLAVATATYSSGRTVAAEEAADRHQVRAVLLTDATRPQRTVRSAAVATVRWTGPAGRTHEGPAPVRDGAPAGSTVTIWVDPEGDRALPPATAGEAVAVAVGRGAVTFMGLAALTLTAYLALLALLDRRRMRRWAREWAVVEPVWSGAAR